MKALLTLAIIFSSTFAMADWDEQQKQNQAKAVFNESTTAQAVKNSRFFKQWPSEYFSSVGRSSLTHDDCISGNTYNGGYTVKCVEWQDIDVSEEGEKKDIQKTCVDHDAFALLKPASQGPKSVTVRFYRKVVGAGSYEQTSGALYVGKREVTIPNCK